MIVQIMPGRNKTNAFCNCSYISWSLGLTKEHFEICKCSLCHTKYIQSSYTKVHEIMRFEWLEESKGRSRITQNVVFHNT